MSETLRILLIESSQADFHLVEHHLRHSGLTADVHWVKNGDELRLAIAAENWDVVLTDHNVPGRDFLDSLKLIRQKLPDVPVILVSGSVGEETAVDLIKAGLNDFVLKDRLSRLVPAIKRSLCEGAEKKKRAAAEQQLARNEQLMRTVLELVHHHTDLSVLIKHFIHEIKKFIGCEAVGVRVLDERGNIPYQAYEGFSRGFFEKESPLSIGSDRCMCINVIRGNTDRKQSFYTPGGSFFMNGTTRFLTTVPEQDKGETRNVCNKVGYESVALVPFRSEGRVIGLIHIADHRENMVPLGIVELLERAVMQLGTAFQRANAQTKLRQSEEKLRAIIDNAKSVVWVKDLEGRFLVVNAFLLNILGKSRDEVIGRTNFDLLPYDQAEEYSKNDRRVIASGLPIEVEEPAILVDGPHTFLSVKFPLYDGNGKIYGISAFSTDITRLKRVESSLKKQEEKFRRLSQEYRVLLDNIPDGIIHLSPQQEMHWINAAAQKMFNLADGETLQEKTFQAALTNCEELCAALPVVRSIASGQNEIGEFSRIDDDRKFEIRAVPVLNESQEVTSVIEIIRDISAHHKLEEQLHQAQKMESIGTFAGGIAHDFNNILTAILGYGELTLEAMPKDDPLRENINIIVQAGLQASHLTKDLLLFSRKQIIDKRELDLNAVISHVEKFIRRIIGEDVQCETNLATRPIPILADGHQLEQVLMNFATNARDAMPRGGTFSITTETFELDYAFKEAHGFGTPGTYCLMTVADTGKGMDKQTVEKIFEPFFTTKERGKGTGLGLAVVYGIIKEHHGYINVYSEPRRGTVFKIYLPVSEAKNQPVPLSKEQASAQGGHETILVAEDEEAVRRLVTTLLRRSGYTVIEAVNGEDAVSRFKENQDTVKLLLFDLVMPKMNGKIAMDAIRQIHPEIKGIFVSGYAPDNIQDNNLFDVRTEMLFKPVSPKELLRTIRRILDTP